MTMYGETNKVCGATGTEQEGIRMGKSISPLILELCTRLKSGVSFMPRGKSFLIPFENLCVC